MIYPTGFAIDNTLPNQNYFIGAPYTNGQVDKGGNAICEKYFPHMVETHAVHTKHLKPV